MWDEKVGFSFVHNQHVSKIPALIFQLLALLPGTASRIPGLHCQPQDRCSLQVLTGAMRSVTGCHVLCKLQAFFFFKKKWFIFFTAVAPALKPRQSSWTRQSWRIWARNAPLAQLIKLFWSSSLAPLTEQSVVTLSNLSQLAASGAFKRHSGLVANLTSVSGPAWH